MAVKAIMKAVTFIRLLYNLSVLEYITAEVVATLSLLCPLECFGIVVSNYL